MNRDEVIKLFKTIKSIYPMFEVNTEKVDTWARMMRKMDHERVMVKVEHYSLENKFPPTIAEIAAYPPEKNDHLDKIKKWKDEAAKVPYEKKKQFKEQLEKLIQEKKE